MKGFVHVKAKGEGEYIKQYAELSQCSVLGRKILLKEIKKNDIKVSGPRSENKPKKACENIGQVIEGDKVLKNECKLYEV